MSDDEFMMDEGGDEDYDFDYEEDDDVEEGDADVENKYYQAKNMRSDNPEKALSEWRGIVDQESPKGEWGFKALKQSTKLNFRRKRYEDALKTYTELLTFTRSAVTRNASEKAINGVLDYVSSASDLDTALMQSWYDVTQASLEESKNERLGGKMNLKLAKIWVDRKEYDLLNKILKELHASIGSTSTSASTEDVSETDNTKGTILLEILAMEIQMYTDLDNTKRLRETYEKTLTVKSAIPHPRIMGIIRECGGKMHMSEKDWQKAQVAFFEAFRNFDEAGSPQRVSSLKYLVLAHMLMDSEIDPFDSQETKPYKTDPEIVAMTNLVSAYQRRDVHEAEKILRDNRKTIMDDPFIRKYIGDVLRSLRTQWILEMVKSYTRIEISYLARQLKVVNEQVEDILVNLILDKKIQGRIDQVTGILQLDTTSQLEVQRYDALKKWTDQISILNNVMITKTSNAAGIGSTGPGGGIATGGGASLMGPTYFLPQGVGGGGGSGSVGINFGPNQQSMMSDVFS